MVSVIVIQTENFSWNFCKTKVSLNLILSNEYVKSVYIENWEDGKIYPLISYFCIAGDKRLKRSTDKSEVVQVLWFFAFCFVFSPWIIIYLK